MNLIFIGMLGMRLKKLLENMFLVFVEIYICLVRVLFFRIIYELLDFCILVIWIVVCFKLRFFDGVK